MKPGLKGFRVRVVVDVPVWDYDRDKAKDVAKKIIENAHSACKVMSAVILIEDEPDNTKLFPEDQPPFNPSERKIHVKPRTSKRKY